MHVYCGPQNAGKEYGALRFNSIWGWVQWLKDELGEVFKERVLRKLSTFVVGCYEYLGVLLDLASRDATMDRYLPADWEDGITSQRRLLFPHDYVTLRMEKRAADLAAEEASKLAALYISLTLLISSKWDNSFAPVYLTAGKEASNPNQRQAGGGRGLSRLQ